MDLFQPVMHDAGWFNHPKLTAAVGMCVVHVNRFHSLDNMAIMAVRMSASDCTNNLQLPHTPALLVACDSKAMTIVILHSQLEGASNSSVCL